MSWLSSHGDFQIPHVYSTLTLATALCLNEGRHAQCNLHTTTDIVLHPEMNAKCTVPFETGVEPKCCASDFTLDEIRALCGKMDSSGSVNLTTPEEYVFGGTEDWRTDLYQYPCPSIPTHKESIELIKSYNGKFTPELKIPEVEMPFEGNFTQEDYAQKMIDEYIEAGRRTISTGMAISLALWAKLGKLEK